MIFAVAVVPERSEPGPGFVVACRGRTLGALGFVPLCAGVWFALHLTSWVAAYTLAHFSQHLVGPRFCKPGLYLHHRIERKN